MRKRKLLITILTGLCACFMSATLFTACGDGDEHSHQYVETTTNSTCTEKGAITYTCSCGDTYTVEIPALGHDEKTHQAQEPTCTEIGWEEYVTCERTGCSYSTYVEIPALGHDEKTHQAQEPTCTEIGWEEYVTCEREGCDYSTYKEISATGVHTWDKGEETKAPTCTEKGETTYTCTVCKTATKTEPIDKLPHEYAEKWTSNATYHWHECECGDKKDEEKHTAGAPATATTPQTCTVCGYILQAETGILFNTLTVEGTKVYGKVSNDTEIFSFINEITVKGNATYVVDVNMSCNDPIESKTVELSVGNNKFYVLEKIGNDVKLFTVTIRRRPMYEVTFNANGGTAVEKQEVEEDDLATEPETTRAGYTFTGWDYDFATPITKKTKITASWSANKDTKYIVNYYLQNLDNDGYTLYESDELEDETDTTANAEIKSFTHFTFNDGYAENKLSGNIDGDGGQVLSVYYTRDSYKIVANNNNAKAGTSTQVNGTYKYDKKFTLTATTNAGYTWLGWYDGETLACKTEEFTFKAEKDVTYTATWSANTDTKYTVNYYLQHLDDDGYALHETVELKGETDTTAYGETERYVHFTCNQNMGKISGNINGDGGQVLSVYYTRDSYIIATERSNTKAGTVTESDTYKFEKQITLTATTNAGYTWLGWYDGETLAYESEEFTFKVEKDVTYTATWSANTDTKYTVNYYLQNLDDDGYALLETVELKGETDTPTAEVDIKEYAHFTYNANESVISGNINGDGGQVLIVYYTRNTYTIAIENSKAGTITNSGNHKYGKEITSTATPNLGYDFVGWYSGEELLSADNTYTFTVDKNVMARFAVKAEMSSFNFSATATTCSITGVKNRSVTEIVVPDYVTSISQGAFNGCSSLKSITIPFVGKERKTATDTYQYPFGYIFGSSSYLGGGAATKQYYYGSSTSSTTYATFYIPTSLKSVTITSGNLLYGAFYNCSSLTSVEIGDNVTSIGERAFANCSNLRSVEIGDGVTSIGERAFYYCSSLTSITIPESVTSIGSYAFYNCSSLTSVEIGDGVTSIGHHAFNNCNWLTSVEIGDGVTSIGPYAFSNCPCLLSVVIPDSVTSIGYEAFSNCDSLTSVEIGDGVTSIGDGAFEECSSLTRVEIGDSVTSIGSSAFNNCSSLTSVYITDIAAWCNISFKNSSANPLYYAKNLYLNNELITELIIPNGVTTIGACAFYNCSSLTSVEIGDSVTSIGSSAFSSCYKLVEVVNKSTHITVKKGDSSNGYVGYYALAVYNSGDVFTSKLSNDNGYIIYTDGNDKILVGYNGIETDLVLPSYITKINQYAFYNCSSLTSVEIGDSVTSIGFSAFGGCSSLESMTIPFVGNSRKTANDTYQYPFGYIFGTNSYTGGTATEQYYYGSSTSSATYTTYYMPTSLKLVTVTGGNILYGAFYNCKTLTSVLIGDGVSFIGESAFYNCSSLTKIILPFIGESKTATSYQAVFGYIFGYTTHSSFTGVRGATYQYPAGTTYYHYYIPASLREVMITGGAIGSYGFNNCRNLTSVLISDSVISIGHQAFNECTKLTNFTIPDSVTSIGSYAFFGCYNLANIEIGKNVTSIGDDAFYDCDRLTNIILPDGVTSIGAYAFRGSGLNEIVIPDSVTSIGAYAFAYCWSLTIKYCGTQTQWQAISKGYNWNYEAGLLLNYNYQG